MQCPLLGWALVLCAGCGLGVAFPHEGASTAAALLLACVAGLALCHKKFAGRTWLLLPLVWLTALAAAMALGARTGRMKTREIAFLETHKSSGLTVEGWISSLHYGKSPAGYPRYEMTLEDLTIASAEGGRLPVNVMRFEMRCVFNAETPAVQPGEYWRFQLHPSRGIYNARSDHMRPFIVASGNMENAVRLEKKSHPLQRRLIRARQSVAERLNLGVSPEHAPEVAIVRALLLGLRGGIPREVREMFRYSGTAHLFAISGLVVGMFAAMMIALLRFTRLRYARWGLVLIPGVLFFGMMTGAAPSAMRACLMLSIYWLVPFFGVRVSALSALAGAAVLLVGTNPVNVLDTGFWLSFTVTAGLIVFTQLLLRVIVWVRRGCAEGMSEVERLARRNTPAWRLHLRNGFESLCAVSLTAWLMAMPLSVYVFNYIVPGGVLANLLIVPLTFCVVCLAGLSLVVGLVWTQGAICVNLVMIALVRVMRGVATLFAIPPVGAMEAQWPWGFAGLLGVYLFLGFAGFWLHLHFARDEVENDNYNIL